MSMQQQLVKRSGETVLCDFNCQLLLGPSESIEGAIQLSAEGPGAALSFGDAQINSEAVTYEFNRQVPAGKVIQVLIGGGSIPSGAAQAAYTVRARFGTTNAGEVREATARLLIIDEPFC